MTAKTDPAVSVTVLSAAMGLSERTLTCSYMAGKSPWPDSIIRDTRNRASIRGWRLSTLRAWNPTVAARCLATLRALETIPLDAA